MKAKEFAQVLGYKSPASAVSLHVDADRHYPLQELLSRPEFGVLDSQSLENLPKAQKEQHWISEPGMYQLLMKSKMPIAKQMERWLTGEVLPSLRRTGKYSATQLRNEPREPREPRENVLEESLVQAQLECLHEDLITKRLANRQARLSLALEAKRAMDTFGQDSTHDVTQAGREAIRIACLPAEKADSQITTLEYLRLRGLSEEQISHVGGILGKIVYDTKF